MDKPKQDSDAGCLVVFISVSFIFMFALGCWRGCREGTEQGERTVRREAIEAGHAEYDATTGEWKWK